MREEAERIGCPTLLVPLSTTGTVAENGRILRDWLDGQPERPVILVSLSKGGPDVKTALAGPDAGRAFRNVVAWVSLCGILDGTLMADWLLSPSPGAVAVRLFYRLRGKSTAFLRDLRYRSGGPLDQPLRLPSSIRLISVVGFPLREHLTRRASRRCHRRLAHLGPNDGALVLADVCALPGLVYPVWGADHYLQPEGGAGVLVQGDPPLCGRGARRVRSEPFLAWPGWDHLREAALLSLADSLWFLLVYGGMDWWTAQRTFRVPVHFAAELRIPFVPAMTVFYMSIYGLFLLAPFVLRTRREFRAAVATTAAAIAVAGVSFLLFPAQLAFAPAREDQLGIWAGLYHLADDLNLTYNLAPSLHVTFAVICVALFSPHASRPVRFALWLWALLIAASTVLTHQHHVLDAVTGWLLALACVRLVAARRADPATS